MNTQTSITLTTNIFVKTITLLQAYNFRWVFHKTATIENGLSQNCTFTPPPPPSCVYDISQFGPFEKLISQIDP